MFESRTLKCVVYGFKICAAFLVLENPSGSTTIESVKLGYYHSETNHVYSVVADMGKLSMEVCLDT